MFFQYEELGLLNNINMYIIEFSKVWSNEKDKDLIFQLNDKAYKLLHKASNLYLNKDDDLSTQIFYAIQGFHAIQDSSLYYEDRNIKESIESLYEKSHACLYFMQLIKINIEKKYYERYTVDIEENK
jgi:hypothetical protein